MNNYKELAEIAFKSNEEIIFSMKTINSEEATVYKQPTSSKKII